MDRYISLKSPYNLLNLTRILSFTRNLALLPPEPEPEPDPQPIPEPQPQPSPRPYNLLTIFLQSPYNLLNPQVRKTQEAPWGGSTDLVAACELILTKAEAQKLKPDELPDLIVFSDMQVFILLLY